MWEVLVFTSFQELPRSGNSPSGHFLRLPLAEDYPSETGHSYVLLYLWLYGDMLQNYWLASTVGYFFPTLIGYFRPTFIWLILPDANNSSYLLGSLIGIFPLMAAYTIMGTSVGDLSSPVFWWALAFNILVCIAAIVILYFLLRKKKNTEGKSL